jgi:1,4-alpha-glucan branching enzyme
MKTNFDTIIVGGGIGGLSALEKVFEKKSSVILFEKEKDVGGLVKSHYEDGYLTEEGPNSFLKSYTHTLDLIKKIGLEDEVLENDPESSNRFVYRNREIHKVPEGPLAFLNSKLFTWSAKFRLLFEPFVPKGKKDEETIREFGYRRFGKEITETVLDAMVSGICVGDIGKLDIHSLFPKIGTIEKKFKSFLFFLLVFKWKMAERGKKKKGKKRTVFYSMKKGMGQISQTIYERHKDKISLNSSVLKISKVFDQYTIETDKGTFFANNLIMATPAHITSDLIKTVDPILSSELKKINYPDVVTVALGFNETNVKHSMKGFGFLAPRNQNIKTLGAFFSSSLFPGRAPEKYKSLKVYLGGVHDLSCIKRKDKEILATIEKEVYPTLGIKGKPDFYKIKRISKAIPQFDVGHQHLKSRIYGRLKKHNNLFLVGNYLEGISVNEVIKSSENLNFEINKIPKIIENDGYLSPFQGVIEHRLKRFEALENRIIGDSKSLYEFANGHKYFGMHRTESEWIFREWAPNAVAIYLVGNFSNWEEQGRYRLSKISDDGVWEIKLPLDMLNHLDLYKLKVCWNGGSGERIPTYANYVIQDEKTHIFTTQIWDPQNGYKFKNQKPKKPLEGPIIYEAHVGMGQIDGKVGSYTEFKDNVLPRVVKAGYNTLQLMAVQEHPYYGSFGYQVSNFFASSSRCGTPDELKELIDTAHGYGLRVIMDIVHSHAVKNEQEGLGLFDGTPYQFFHGGGRGLHPAWDTMCFDYGKDQVLHFLLSNCKYWTEEFQFDGFRFDGVTSMLYHHHGLGKAFSCYDDYFNHEVDEDALGYLFLANKLIHQCDGHATTIAEDMSGMPGLGASIDHGGIGFDYRLAMGIPDFWIKLLKETSDEDWNMDHIWHELNNLRDDERSISYAESHDQALVGDKTIIFWLIDKDMYTNMEVDNRNLSVDRGIALHKMIRLITLATAKGGYLNFMGNEFGHPEWIDFPREGNGWSYHYARRQWQLLDNEKLAYKFLANFDREMINLIKDHSVPSSNPGHLKVVHCDDHVLGFERAGLFFIFNFDSSRSFVDYQVSIDSGTYQLVLSSDSKRFGGFNRLEESLKLDSIVMQKGNVKESKLSLYLPCRTALIFKKIN